MTGDIPTLPTPPNATVRVYLPREAYERITKDDVQAAAKRLRYDGPLHWEASTHNIPDSAPADSMRVTCGVPEAKVLFEAFRELVDVASAGQEDDLLMACADALVALTEGIESANERSR